MKQGYFTYMYLCPLPYTIESMSYIYLHVVDVHGHCICEFSWILWDMFLEFLMTPCLRQLSFLFLGTGVRDARVCEHVDLHVEF